MHRLRIVLAATAMLGAPYSLVGQSALRESFELQVLQPPAIVTMDGRPLLVSELHLTNFSGNALEVSEVRLLDGETRAVVASLAGEALAKNLCVVGTKPACAPVTAITPGQRAILYVDAAVSARMRIDSLVYEVHSNVSLTSLPIRVTHSPVVLGAPLRGGPWMAVHHSEWPRGHRRVTYTVDGRVRIPGRFAIDWVKVDEGGRTSSGDEDRVSASFSYGAEVLAVTDGTIANARTDMPESETVSANPRHTLDEAAGNFIALKVKSGEFVIYEHLRPGSIRVKVGDRVRKGAVIAQLGFTGDSTGPHLHMHVADGPTPLGSEGIPYVFEEYTGADSNPRKREWPGFNAVVRFRD